MHRGAGDRAEELAHGVERGLAAAVGPQIGRMNCDRAVMNVLYKPDHCWTPLPGLPVV